MADCHNSKIFLSCHASILSNMTAGNLLAFFLPALGSGPRIHFGNININGAVIVVGFLLKMLSVVVNKLAEAILHEAGVCLHVMIGSLRISIGEGKSDNVSHHFVVLTQRAGEF